MGKTEWQAPPPLSWHYPFALASHTKWQKRDFQTYRIYKMQTCLANTNPINVLCPSGRGVGAERLVIKTCKKYFHMWKCVKCKSWSLPFVYPGCWLLTATSWLLDNSSSFCCLIFHFVSCPVCFALLRSWLFFVCSVCTMWASGAVAKEITTNPFVKLQTETEPSPPLIQLPLMAFSVLVFGQSAAMCFLEAGMRLISLLEIIFLR